MEILVACLVTLRKGVHGSTWVTMRFWILRKTGILLEPKRLRAATVKQTTTAVPMAMTMTMTMTMIMTKTMTMIMTTAAAGVDGFSIGVRRFFDRFSIDGRWMFDGCSVDVRQISDG